MNLLEERAARSELLSRQRRYLAGDGADWVEMYRQRRITDDELFANTGFTDDAVRIVAIPANQFLRRGES